MYLPSTNIAEHLFRKDEEKYNQKKDSKFAPLPCADSGHNVKTKGGKNVASTTTCYSFDKNTTDIFVQQSLLSQMYKYMSGNNSLK